MYLNLLNTIHCPVTSDGNLIKNSFGVVIAEVKSRDGLEAAAMAALINLGVPAAQLEHMQYLAREKALRIRIKR